MVGLRLICLFEALMPLRQVTQVEFKLLRECLSSFDSRGIHNAMLIDLLRQGMIILQLHWWGHWRDDGWSRGGMCIAPYDPIPRRTYQLHKEQHAAEPGETHKENETKQGNTNDGGGGWSTSRGGPLKPYLILIGWCTGDEATAWNTDDMQENRADCYLIVKYSYDRPDNYNRYSQFSAG
jgi:hypothetical protein